MRALAAAKERFGSLPSALVLNAAMGGADVVGDVETISMGSWRAVFEVNVIGSVLGLGLPAGDGRGWCGRGRDHGQRRLLPGRAGHRRLLLHEGDMLQLGRCVAMDIARGIRVNVLCAGIVDTPGFRRTWRRPASGAF